MLKNLTAIFFILGIILSAPMGYAESLGVLKGILNPANIEVSSGQVYIIEGATVYVYSLPDLRLIRTFGQEGEGPGELKVTPWLANGLYVRPESVIVDSIDKYIIFSREGEVLREGRRSQQYSQSIPAGDVFVVRKRIEEEKRQFSSINIMTPDLQSEIDLYRQEFSAGFRQLNVLPDSIHYAVYKDRIYVEESPKGFVFEIFDLGVNKLHTIDIDSSPLRVSKQDRLDAEERIKTDPFSQNVEGGWEALKSQVKLIYPDRFPPIRDFQVVGDRIYVQTFLRQEGEEEYVILDLEGNMIEKVLLPQSFKPGFTEEMMGTGIKYYAFDSDAYYYLEIKEEWCELHRVFLK